MTIGGFGPLVFGVRLGGGLFMESLEASTKIRFVEHEIMNSKSIMEFTGYNSDEVSFSMLFVEGWTMSPMVGLPLLLGLARRPFPFPLIVGQLPVGGFTSTFVISEVGSVYRKVNLLGGLAVAGAKVSMREYSIGIGSTAASYLSLAGGLSL